MHPSFVSHSFVVSPIIRKLSLPDSGSKVAGINTGISKERAKEIFGNVGDPATLDEVARLAALAGLELSIIPSGFGAKAFTEVEKFPTIHVDPAVYPKRVMDMIEKVCDFCIDMRIDTQLSSTEFDRLFRISPDFLANACDVGKAGNIRLDEIFAYLERFGATMATFPRESDLTNYYRTLVEMDREAANDPMPSARKVA